MLSVAHLLDQQGQCPTFADGAPLLPHCPTFENGSGAGLNQGMTGPSPTCPTCPTKKQAVREKLETGSETPISIEPLPGRYFIDPIEHHYLVSVKTMQNLSECRGYPQACQRCRALMADMQTCLLGPGGDDER